MENQAIQNPTPEPNLTPVQVSEPKAKFPVMYLVLSLFVLVLLASTAFLYYQNMQLKNMLAKYPVQTAASPTPTSYQSPVPSTTTNPTANWKTYNNKVLKYTINYPSDWLIDTSEAELPISTENSQKLVIYKGQYKLTILWPSAYGPGICLFDDQSRTGAPEMASYCEGKYVEFTSNNNKETHRRLVKPESFSDHQQWEVYTKEKTYFVTVPPIRFTAPLDYITDQIDLMDQILSSYKSTN